MMKDFGIRVLAVTIISALLLTGCGSSGTAESPASADEPARQEGIPAQEQPETRGEPETTPSSEEATILVAAAASLERSYRDELIPLFQEQYPHITVKGTYDSSGKLQTQIEEGLAADVFMSAAMKQVNELREGGLIVGDTVIPLLENRIVLIASAASETAIDSYEGIVHANTVALGDPESVPVGQYAREALTTLGIYDAIQAKASIGTNVTEVLNWVAEGSAEVGIVYATDAYATDRVKIIAEAPAGSLAEKVIYPVGVVSTSANPEAAGLFVDFLASPQALAVFEAYGFSPNPEGF